MRPRGPGKDEIEFPGTCAHEPCTCAVPDQLYCSEACTAAHAANTSGGEQCACGHEGCEATVEATGPASDRSSSEG